VSSGKAIASALLSDRLQGTLFTVWLPSYFLFGSYFILCYAIICQEPISAYAIIQRNAQ
jgi:hypothetical protein